MGNRVRALSPSFLRRKERDRAENRHVLLSNYREHGVIALSYHSRAGVAFDAGWCRRMVVTEVYVGLDVPDKTTHICAVHICAAGADGKVAWRGGCTTDREVVANTLKAHCPELVRIVLETGRFRRVAKPGPRLRSACAGRTPLAPDSGKGATAIVLALPMLRRTRVIGRFCWAPSRQASAIGLHGLSDQTPPPSPWPSRLPRSARIPQAR